MKRMFVQVGALALAASFGLSAAGHAGQTLTCTFKDQKRNNTIPSEVVVKLADDGKSAIVNDAAIQRHIGKPVPAKLVKLTSKVYRIEWEILDAVGGGGAVADLDYRLFYKPKKGSADLHFSARGYPNKDRGRGSCALK